jgi:hypothetical protein
MRHSNCSASARDVSFGRVHAALEGAATGSEANTILPTISRRSFSARAVVAGCIFSVCGSVVTGQSVELKLRESRVQAKNAQQRPLNYDEFAALELKACSLACMW